MQKLRQKQKRLRRCEPLDECQHSEDFSVRSSLPPVRSLREKRQNHLSTKTTFRCSFCDQSFESKFHRNEHEKGKHGPERDPEHLCTEAGCDKRFISKTTLDKHVQTVGQNFPKFQHCSHDLLRFTLRRNNLYVRDAARLFIDQTT
jgi:uncharacterized Zn-finger protein